MQTELVYRELQNVEEFLACCELQKAIFNIQDIDVVPPVYLNLLTREFPRIGYALGAFDVQSGESKLVGYLLSTTTKVKDSVYGMSFGVLPSYLTNGIGLGLNIASRRLALELGFETFYCVYEPLEGNLGNLYYDKFGMKGVKYEIDTKTELELNIPNDKVLIQWDLKSEELDRKMKREHVKIPLNDLLIKYPIVQLGDNADSEIVFIQIPDDYIAIRKKSKNKAMDWRMKTRSLFNEYINNKNYTITEFYTRIEKGKRENFYCLEK